MNYLFRPQDLPPKIPYEKIFNQLPSFADDTRKKRGRPAFSKDSILRALIYKYLRGLPSLSELAFELKNNLVLAETLGFPAFKTPPIIPKNPRATRKDNFIVKKDTIICPANLEMYRRGKMNSRGRIYLQYSCPLYYGKKYKGQFLVCPASHPKYFSQKGCNHLLRLSPTVREYIDYNSQRFKEIYNQRTSVERVFSRLLKITMLSPSVVDLRATQNHCTIAHITVLLIALAAHRSGADDKIRFVKTFLPNLTL